MDYWVVKKNVGTVTEWENLWQFESRNDADDWICELCFVNGFPTRDYRVVPYREKTWMIQKKVVTKDRWLDLRYFDDEEEAFNWVCDYCHQFHANANKYMVVRM